MRTGGILLIGLVENVLDFLQKLLVSLVRLLHRALLIIFHRLLSRESLGRSVLSRRAHRDALGSAKGLDLVLPLLFWAKWAKGQLLFILVNRLYKTGVLGVVRIESLARHLF